MVVHPAYRRPIPASPLARGIAFLVLIALAWAMLGVLPARADPAATTTGLVSSKSSFDYGEPYVLTATVSGGATTPTGEVEFFDGSTSLGKSTLTGGTARLENARLAVGNHRVTAGYLGDADHAGSVSAEVSLFVTYAASILTMSVEPAFARPGDPLTLHVEVETRPPSTAKPNGRVEIRRDKILLGSAVVTDGVATFATRAIAGDNLFEGIYNGPNVQSAIGWGQRLGNYNQSYDAQVNTPIEDDQTDPAAAGVHNGAVVAYVSHEIGSSIAAIYAQHFDAQGLRIGQAVLVSPADAVQAGADVVGLVNGGYVVVWHRNTGKDGFDVFARVYSESDVPNSKAVRVNVAAAGHQTRARVAPTASGGFVVAWQSTTADGSGSGIVARRFLRTAVAETGEILVNTTKAGDQTAPAIAAMGNGTYVIGWLGSVGAAVKPFWQRFSASGTRMGGQVAVPVAANAVTTDVKVAGLSGSAFAVAWEQRRDPAQSTPRDIWLQRYLASGARSGAPVRALDPADPRGADGQMQAAATLLARGRLAFVWIGAAYGGSGLWGEFFDARFVRMVPRFQINNPVMRYRRYKPAIAPLPGGESWLAAWVADGQDGWLDGIFSAAMRTPK